jgi:hypothetical protein
MATMMFSRSALPPGLVAQSVAREEGRRSGRRIRDVPTWSRAGREAAGVAATGLGKTFSLLRGRRRAFHPEGCSFRARLEVGEPEPLAEGLLPVGSHEAVVRLSRAAGLPRDWPDFPSLAVKVHHAGGGDLDLLLISCGPGAAGKYVMLPGQRFFERPYSSFLRYENGPHQVLVGVLPPRGPGPTFEELRRGLSLEGTTFDVVVAPPAGGWRHAGWLMLGDPYPEGETLAFDPWNVPGPARPAGFFNWLRTRAYPASQHTRGALKTVESGQRRQTGHGEPFAD